MLKALKRVIPESVLRQARAIHGAKNRKSIIAASRNQQRILLQPVNRVEHYYHFLFDLCLPLAQVIERVDEQVHFVIEDFGIFSPRVAELFSGRVEIVDRDSGSNGDSAHPLLGMNAQWVGLHAEHFASLKRMAVDVYKQSASTPQNLVLLIERMPPNDYFANHAIKKGAGSSRRSIPNHAELQEAIAGSTPADMEFRNVRLEELDFAEQIDLFDRAAVVVGQHGAGLANCLWMRANAKVIELSHDPRLRHFQRICHAMHNEHRLLLTDGPHAPVSVAPFRDSRYLLCSSTRTD